MLIASLVLATSLNTAVDTETQKNCHAAITEMGTQLLLAREQGATAEQLIDSIVKDSEGSDVDPRPIVVFVKRLFAERGLTRENIDTLTKECVKYVMKKKSTQL